LLKEHLTHLTQAERKDALSAILFPSGEATADKFVMTGFQCMSPPVQSGVVKLLTQKAPALCADSMPDMMSMITSVVNSADRTVQGSLIRLVDDMMMSLPDEKMGNALLDFVTNLKGTDANALPLALDVFETHFPRVSGAIQESILEKLHSAIPMSSGSYARVSEIIDREAARMEQGQQ
jgi:hypothetical protein